MSTDVSGQVTYLNAIAERLTGWSNEQAIGRPLQEVFKIINGTTRETAQHVETSEQLKFLRQHNCPLGQGFYFSHPLPPKKMEDLLRLGPIELLANASMHTNAA